MTYGPFTRPPVKFLACDQKAKHTITITSMRMNKRQGVRFRLCDFHFEYLRQHIKKYQEARNGELKANCVDSRGIDFSNGFDLSCPCY